MNDDPWAEYARLQQFADSSVLNAKAWGLDEALEAILDKIEAGKTVSPRQAENLLTNRAAKHRHRRKILSENALVLAIDNVAHEESRVLARCRLSQFIGCCSERERQVLLSICFGETYADLASAHGVPESTIKTWVRRARLRLAA